MNEQANSPPAALLNALETAVESLLIEMVKDGQVKPSPEAVRIAARLIAKKAQRHAQQNQGTEPMQQGSEPQ